MSDWLDAEPQDATVRDRIIVAAGEHFRRNGYARTSLCDVATDVGYSKTYLYRFFASKQAIGEAICGTCFGRILNAVDVEIASRGSAADRLRYMLRTIAETGRDLFFEERRLYEVAATSSVESWASSLNYYTSLRERIEMIVAAGRETGEFERKTPLDEVGRSILLAMQPFVDARAISENLDLVPDGVNELSSLILRSLAA